MSPLLRRPLMRETLQPAAGRWRSHRDPSGPITFRILGPLEVLSPNGRELPLSGPAQKTLLAFLLLHANRPVAHERVAEALWGVDAGYTIKRLQMAVTRLRKSLKPLRATPTTAPADGRRRLPARGRARRARRRRLRAAPARGASALEAGDPVRAAAILREADALWRGPALSDVAFAAFAQDEIRRLDELRLSALEARVDADLALGRHADLVGELESLVAAHPTRDRFAAQLMLALYRCGRQVEALDVYQRARARLAPSSGSTPAPSCSACRRGSSTRTRRCCPRRSRCRSSSRRRRPARGRRTRVRAGCAEHWERARAGRADVVAITGRHGIGKTRLAAELRGVGARGRRGRPLRGGRPHDSGPTRCGTAPDAAGGRGVDRPTLDAPALRAGDVPVLTILIVAGGDSCRGCPWRRARSWSRSTRTRSRRSCGPTPARLRRRTPPTWLFERSGGVPARVHAEARQWARRESARRVGVAAHRTAAGRAELRSMEAELADEVAGCARSPRPRAAATPSCVRSKASRRSTSTTRSTSSVASG